MNYLNHYNMLIEKAQGKTYEKTTYTEKHHIVPRCMHGDNSKENIVELLPEEHYVAHQLLVKIYPDNNKLIYAAKMMTHGNNRNNKLYKWLKIKHAQTVSKERKGKKLSIEHRKKLSEAHTGKTLSPEHAAKIKASNIGRKFKIVSCPHCRAEGGVSAMKRWHFDNCPSFTNKERVGKPMSDSHKRKISESMKGICHSRAAINKQSATKKENYKETVSCPHCGKEGSPLGMKRWHFDNCKLKP